MSYLFFRSRRIGIRYRIPDREYHGRFGRFTAVSSEHYMLFTGASSESSRPAGGDYPIPFYAFHYCVVESGPDLHIANLSDI